VLDADGQPLALGIAAKPFLVKPNRTEVERMLGAMAKKRVSLVDAASQIHQEGAEVVVLSQGSYGAIMVSDQGTWRAFPPTVPAVSTVGTGDAMVAGLVQVLSQGGAMSEALRLGAAAGAAAALTEGTQLCHQADVIRLISRVQVHAIAQPAAPVLASAL
jgi:fructose-1-phosphate kinase PfkB-like protein